MRSLASSQFLPENLLQGDIENRSEIVPLKYFDKIDFHRIIDIFPADPKTGPKTDIDLGHDLDSNRLSRFSEFFDFQDLQNSVSNFSENQNLTQDYFNAYSVISSNAPSQEQHNFLRNFFGFLKPQFSNDQLNIYNKCISKGGFKLFYTQIQDDFKWKEDRSEEISNFFLNIRSFPKSDGDIENSQFLLEFYYLIKIIHHLGMYFKQRIDLFRSDRKTISIGDVRSFNRVFIFIFVFKQGENEFGIELFLRSRNEVPYPSEKDQDSTQSNDNVILNSNIDSFLSYQKDTRNVCKKVYMQILKENTPKNSYIIPIYNGIANSLFNVECDDNVTVQDIYYDNTRVLVSVVTTSNKLCVYEGEIGTQNLENQQMYLCFEIDFREKQILLSKFIVAKRVSVVVAVKNDNRSFNFYQFYKEEFHRFTEVPSNSELQFIHTPNTLLNYSIKWNSEREPKVLSHEENYELIDFRFQGALNGHSTYGFLFKTNDGKLKIVNVDSTKWGNYSKFDGYENPKSTEPYKNPILVCKNVTNTKNKIVFEVSENIENTNPKPGIGNLSDSTKYHRVIAVEINNNLFINTCPDLINTPNETIIYYHPPRIHFQLKDAINSLFYEYKCKCDKIDLFKSEYPVGIIKAYIDVGFNLDVNALFHTSNLIPGIYYIEKQSQNQYSKLCLFFANAGNLVGKNKHRTKCQLAAVYSCATVFYLYGPGVKIRKYAMNDETIDNWVHYSRGPPTTDTLIDVPNIMLSNLLSTYGVLLQMKSDLEFDFALRTLQTTEKMADDFYKFYEAQFDD